MRVFGVLSAIWLAVAVVQQTVLPVFLPAAWRPDVALAAGLASLAFLPARTGLLFVFALGVQSDLLASPRLGALTVCYLFAAWLVRLPERDLIRGGPWSAWLAAAAGTFFAYGAYAFVGALAGERWFVAEGFERAFQHTLAALGAGGVAAFALAELYAWTGLLGPGALQRRRPDDFGRPYLRQA